MSSFTITTPGAEVALSPSTVKRKETAKGTVTYAVTNISGTTIRTALRVKPGSGADSGWFKVRGGEERDIGPGATEHFSVDLAVPGERVAPDVPNEQRPKHSFHAIAVNLKDSDNDTEAGSAVAFRAPHLDESGGGVKWWMIAAPAALVILVVAAVFAIPRMFGDDNVVLADWTGEPVEDARAALDAQGLTVEELHPSGLQPALQAAPFYRRVVQSQNPPSDGTVTAERGSRVTLTWEWTPLKVTVPDLDGRSLDNAIQALEETGLRFITAQGPPQPQPENHIAVVSSWSPRGEVDAGSGVTVTLAWQESRGRFQIPVRLEELRQQRTPVLLRREFVQPNTQ